jgi:hypothetical protein
MNQTAARYEVAYNTDLVVADPGELSTLAIFYDQLVLPSTTPESSRSFVEFERHSGGVKITAFEVRPSSYITAARVKRLVDNEVAKWDARYEPLFHENVLRRLPAGSMLDGDLAFLRPGVNFDALLESVLRCRRVLRYRNGLGREQFSIRQDQLLHLMRSDISMPSIFNCSPERPPREVLKALLAHETFHVLLPAINALHPEQMLEVRGKIADTREGFSMHLQTLSKEVEARIKGLESTDELRAYAKSVVETTLEPDYREFRRQIAAEREGFWGKVLDVSGKVFEINAAPWTPKFYGQLLKALGAGIVESADVRRKTLPNKMQAYHFMRRVEQVES